MLISTQTRLQLQLHTRRDFGTDAGQPVDFDAKQIAIAGAQLTSTQTTRFAIAKGHTVDFDANRIAIAIARRAHY